MGKIGEILVFVVVLCAVIDAVPLGTDDAIDSSDSTKGFLKTLKKCSSENEFSDIVHCAAKRVMRSLDKMSTEDNIEILPGVTLESDKNHRTAKSLYEEDTNGDKNVVNLILNATSRFISGKTLKVKIPESTPKLISNAIEEARGKLKNKTSGGKWMMGIGAAMLGLFPFLLGGLALFATKALIIGKIALIISVISFIQYFIRGYDGGFTNYIGGGGYNFLGPQPTYGVPGVSYGTNNIGGVAPNAGYPYSRSFDVHKEDIGKSGQDIAYTAHRK